ncbi:MAG: hypothetical protein KDJ52_30210, partial [Anaerolineae bacterium]|nr:hypothetical protein [Anaerolineae bacterium]
MHRIIRHLHHLFAKSAAVTPLPLTSLKRAGQKLGNRNDNENYRRTNLSLSYNSIFKGDTRALKPVRKNRRP